MLRLWAPLMGNGKDILLNTSSSTVSFSKSVGSNEIPSKLSNSGAYPITGSSHKITIGSVLPKSNKMTIAFWAYKKSGMRLRINSNLINLTTSDTISVLGTSLCSSGTNEVWNHHAVTLEWNGTNTTVVYYLNGRKTYTTSGLTINFTSLMENGFIIDSGAASFVAVQDLRYYDEIISTNEIYWLSKAEIFHLNPNEGIYNYNSPVSTSSILDSSGFKNSVSAESNSALEYSSDNYFIVKSMSSSEDELAGTWVFNDVLTSDEADFNVNFTSSISTCVRIYRTTRKDNLMNYIDGSGTPHTVYISAGWLDEAYKTITITSKLSEVTNGDTLLAWLQANATKQ